MFKPFNKLHLVFYFLVHKRINDQISPLEKILRIIVHVKNSYLQNLHHNALMSRLALCLLLLQNKLLLETEPWKLYWKILGELRCFW